MQTANENLVGISGSYSTFMRSNSLSTLALIVIGLTALNKLNIDCLFIVKMQGNSRGYPKPKVSLLIPHTIAKTINE